jgi:hypothetical protein
MHRYKFICDTPSHDGHQCYQLSSISIKAFKSYGPDTICTDRRTDGRKDRQSDSYIHFGFLCRTYLKGYLNRCQMEKVNECLIYQKQKVSQLNPNSVIGRLLKINIRYKYTRPFSCTTYFINVITIHRSILQ